MPRALLTGANGFLGRYIYDVLQQSFQVDTLGLHPSNNYITDISTGSISLNHSYDLVVHAAAKSDSNNDKDADLFFQINRDGSRRICEAFDKLGTYPKQFVFISSVAVYGALQGRNINEDYPLNGISPYAKSKIEAERIIESWCNEYGIVCTILRLPLIAGRGSKGNIAKMIDAIRKNRFFIIGKGDAQKSMVLPQDVAEFIPVIAIAGGVYNLTGEGHPSIAQFAEIIAGQLKKPRPVKIPFWFAYVLAKIGDMSGKKFPINGRVLTQLTSELTFSDQKARQSAGWKPNPVLKYFTI